jgi:PPOX class probable F420-dependent enzyme
MTDTPTTDLDARFGEPDAPPVRWEDGRAVLERAELFWVSTVRADGRPHVTPLIGLWADGALHFTTGPEEQKAVNLRTNPHVVLTTGTNTWAAGLDVVVEGTAVRVDDDATLHRLADGYRDKYGDAWSFDVADGGFRHGSQQVAHVFRVEASTIFGFGKSPHTQTRWRF